MVNGMRDSADGIHNAVELPPSPAALRLEAAIASGWPDVADVLRDWAADGDGGGGPEMAALLQVAQAPDPDATLLRRASRAALAEIAGLLDRRVPLTVPQLVDDWPPTLLSGGGLGGALLTAGEILVVAGDGGIGKSTLLTATLLGIAGRESTGVGRLPGGIFEAVGGPVLYAAHEDRGGVVGSVARWAATNGPWSEASDDARAAALGRFHVLGMRGRPLFGPPSGGSYNAPPGALPGWADLWEAAAAIRPAVVVVDPALAAYTGDANSAPPVRAFLDALRGEAEKLGCGVIIAAHSVKAARRARQNPTPDPFDVGQVGGSAAWFDGVRGVLSLTRRGGAGDGLTVAVCKSNYGPAWRLLDVRPVRRDRSDRHNGALCGFVADSAGWQRLEEWQAKQPDGDAEGRGDDGIPVV